MRVVVADNDPDALALVVTDLALSGHDVVGQAGDGDECLSVARRTAPDVVVVDYRMPGRNGSEVARSLAREMPAVRVIVYSNYSTPAVRKAVTAAGARFIAKGDLRVLRQAVGAP